MKYKNIMLFFTIIILLLTLTACQKQEDEVQGYYIKMLYDDTSKSFSKQSVSIEAIKSDLLNEYNSELELVNINKNSKDDALMNKVIKLKSNSNTWAIYDIKDKEKLISVIQGTFNNADELYLHIEDGISTQTPFYSIEETKYLYVNNSNDIKYKDLKRYSSINNFYEIVYNQYETNYLNKIANNYAINPNDDDLLIFDKFNNLLIHYNMENTNYFTNPSDGSINLDATIVAHLLKISPSDSKNVILHFYNKNDNYNKQIEELKIFNTKSKVKYQIINIPLENNDAKTNAIMTMVKEVFSVENNEAKLVYIPSFNDFNNREELGYNKTSQNLLNYFNMK